MLLSTVLILDRVQLIIVCGPSGDSYAEAAAKTVGCVLPSRMRHSPALAEACSLFAEWSEDERLPGFTRSAQCVKVEDCIWHSPSSQYTRQAIQNLQQACTICRVYSLLLLVTSRLSKLRYHLAWLSAIQTRQLDSTIEHKAGDSSSQL